MHEHIDSNDPRLLDLIAEELEHDEALRFEEALNAPGNEEALQELNALRAAAGIAVDALRREVPEAAVALTREKRAAVLEKARRQEDSLGQRRPSRRGVYRLLAAAAALVVCAGVGWWVATMTTTTRRGYYTGDTRGDRELIARQKTEPGNSELERGEVVMPPDVHLLPMEPLLERDTANMDWDELAAGRDLSVMPEPKHTTMPRLEPAPQAVQEPMPYAAPPPLPVPDSAPVSVGRLRSLGDADRLEVRMSIPRDQEVLDTVRSLGYAARDSESAPPVLEHVLPLPEPDMRRFPGGESYTRIEERPFARADEEPLSTFSLHPDSAAYANIRRFLQQGQMPPRDAVRIEELVNYFSYDYPQPTGPHPFSVTIELGPCPWASGHMLAKVGLQGREIPREERPQANLVFLIDTSGSMNRPNRLPLVQESLKALLENLNAEDRVGIVTYAGKSEVALESTPVTQRDRILRVIEGLNAAGSTHGSAGIQDAYAVAKKHFIEGGINRVIIATDGDFNVGVTSRDGLLSLIEEKRKSNVFLTVLGYGMGNLKDGTLELLASKGNGNYAYIDSYGEARRVLIEQLSGTLMTIAKDTKIQVEFNPGRVRSYRLLGYENRQLAARDFNDDAKDAGEMGAGHTVTALYQIVPHGIPVEAGVDALRYQAETDVPTTVVTDTRELMFVKLRYKQPDSDTSALLEIPVPAPSAVPVIEKTSKDYRFAAAVAGFGLLLRDSQYKGEASYDLVRKIAESALNDDRRREDFLDLVITAETRSGN